MPLNISRGRPRIRNTPGHGVYSLTQQEVIIWDFKDNFSISDSAPITNPLVADRFGTLNVVLDSADNTDVANGNFEFNGAVVQADPRIYTTESWAREAGRAFFFRARIVTGSDSNIFVGIDSLTTSRPNDNGFNLRTIPDFRLLVNSTSLSGSFVLTIDIDYDFVIVCRDAGAFYYVKGGSEFPSWTLVFVDSATTSSPVFLGFAANDVGVSQSVVLDTAGVVLLHGEYSTDFGLSIDHLSGSRSAGDTFVHSADTIIEFVETTVPSALQTELSFRVQDADNKWTTTIDSANTIDLNEVVAGTPTQRATSVGTIVNGDRIQLRLIDEVITTLDPTGQLSIYSSAANFKTETSGELDTEGTNGAVDDIATWPLDANFDVYFIGA